MGNRNCMTCGHMLVCEARKKIERLFKGLDPMINQEQMLEARPGAPVIYDAAEFCSEFEYSERMAAAVHARQRKLGLA